METKIWLLMLGLLMLPACSKHTAPQSAAMHVGYHCPMHPQYHSDKPGDCPICGMKLVADTDSNRTESTVPGQGIVNVSSAQQQLSGVKVAPVEMRDLYVIVRASARVA